MKQHLVFISNEIAKDTGGIQSMSYAMCKYLGTKFDETIICSADSSVDSLQGVRILKSQYPSRDFNKLRRDFISILQKLHKRHKVDFVLCAQYSICTCALLLKRRYGVPYGVLVHGNEVMGNVGNIWYKTLLLNYYRYVILKSSAVIVSNSEYTANLVKKITTKSKIKIINPPINMPQIATEEITNIRKESYELFSIARHVKRKGFQLVIRCLPELIKKFPLLHYNIGGTGEYTPYLKDLVRELHLENHVNFLGRLSEQEKMQYMKQCSLFVMPSFSIPEENSVEGLDLCM